MTNKERRDAGLLYQVDEELTREMIACRKLLQRLNTADCSDYGAVEAITQELLQGAKNAFVNLPFHCDYGYNIHVGENFYANYNCTILDVAEVTIGDNCMLGPDVSIYTAGHPLHPAVRNSLWEYGIPVTIGDNVWIGGHTVILPGVTIGNNVVIGAGSVVTKDIPDQVVAAGNPCRVIRPITDKDRDFYYKDRRTDPELLENLK